MYLTMLQRLFLQF